MFSRRASLLALAAAAVAACTPSQDATSAPAPTQGMSLATLPAKVTGFTLGKADAPNVLYVFFDMQCPHCGMLWLAAQPLAASGNVKFVWVPVHILSRASLAQGATILGEADPVQAMSKHEESLLARQGGMSAVQEAVSAHSAKVTANTAVLTGAGITGVPYIVGRHPATGQQIAQTGALDTAGLKSVFGL